jgi:enamine deaminase RidA (YjgF/YER057c/UK114 family)
MDVGQRLAALGLKLPPAPAPVGSYRRGVIHGGIGWLSGQFPIRDGKPLFTGLVGRELSDDQGRAAAQAAALNVLAQLCCLLDDFDRFASLLRVDGYVASAPGWFRQPAVLDGASDLFARVLAERGDHARSAMGVASLPLDMPVELVVSFAVRS